MLWLQQIAANTQHHMIASEFPLCFNSSQFMENPQQMMV